MASALITVGAIVGFLALTVGTALFVAAEFSLTALEKSTVDADVRDRGDRRSRQVQNAHRTLSFQLSGAQLGITITTLVTGYLAEPVLSKFLRPALEWTGMPEVWSAALTLILALVIATSLSMVLGELAPKNLAIARPLQTARLTAGAQSLFSSTFRFAISFLNRSANALVRRLGIEPAEELSSARSAQELSALVRNSAAQGAIDEMTAELVGRSLEFGELTAEELMTPRQRIHSLDADDTVADLVALSIESGHSRFPVVRGDLDDTIGLVHVKQALTVPAERRATVTVADIATTAPVVPATLDGDALMDQLRANGLQMALVVDEYGGSAGIVTVEDLIEEIVGDVRDEHDANEPIDVQRTDDGYLCSGLLRVDELERDTGYRAPEGDYDTLGGLVMFLLGRIPAVGDRVPLPHHPSVDDDEAEAPQWSARVARMDGRRVDLVEVTHEGPPGRGPDRAAAGRERLLRRGRVRAHRGPPRPARGPRGAGPVEREGRDQGVGEPVPHAGGLPAGHHDLLDPARQGRRTGHRAPAGEAAGLGERARGAAASHLVHGVAQPGRGAAHPPRRDGAEEHRARGSRGGGHAPGAAARRLRAPRASADRGLQLARDARAAGRRRGAARRAGQHRLRGRAERAHRGIARRGPHRRRGAGAADPRAADLAPHGRRRRDPAHRDPRPAGGAGHQRRVGADPRRHRVRRRRDRLLPLPGAQQRRRVHRLPPRQGRAAGHHGRRRRSRVRDRREPDPSAPGRRREPVAGPGGRRPAATRRAPRGRRRRSRADHRHRGAGGRGRGVRRHRPGRDPPGVTVLSDAEWEARAADHRARLEPFVEAHRSRAARGEKHPVWDFLFTYYGHRPAHLLRWHPGLGTELDGPRAADEFSGARGYLVEGTRVRPDPATLAKRAGTAEYVARLLEATAARRPVFGCFGLHEWAMVYREADQARHPVPLRLGPAGTDEVVRAGRLTCTHYDAYRFFTPDAVPRNAIELTRETQVGSEQPGCLHAGMDLYKWAFKLTPGAPSDLVADAFDLARDARELDMRASPYDLAGYGFEPIAIETPDGRREYVRQQAALAERAAPIREQLLAVVRSWPGERPAADMSGSPA